MNGNRTWPNSNRLFAFVSGLLFIAWLGVSGHSAETVPSVQERFVAGLRERRLFRQAEIYCQRELKNPRTTVAQRGTLTLELIRTLAEQALNLPPDQRKPIWEKAESIAAEFATREPQHPQLSLVRAQSALTTLTRGELARLESEIAPNPAASVEEARATIRQATRQLEELSQDLEKQLLSPKPANQSADELTREELASLQHHLRYELGRAYRNQALSYPEGSADRAAALTQSLEHLARPLQQLPPDDDLAAKIRLDQAICYRLLKDFEVAKPIFDELDSDSQPAVIRSSARAEKIRLHLANNDTAAAQELAAKREGSVEQRSADFDFAILETYVHLWQQAAQANNEKETTKWRDQSIQAVKYIEQTHGPYWGRRADVLLVRSGGQQSGGSIEILKRAADDLYLKGRLDEAAAAYDRVAQTARENNNPSGAFEFSYKAALVQQKAMRYGEAAKRFRALALEMTNHPQAGNAHLLAVANQAQQLRTDPSLREDYVALLEEHVAQWPYDATTNTARLWLGSAREREKNWPAAIAAYEGIRRDDKSFHEGMQGAERCWLALLTEHRAAGKSFADEATRAARFFHDSALTSEKKLPTTWDTATRDCALAAARIQLLFIPGSHAEAEKLLESALTGEPPPPAEWANSAKSLLVIALAGQPGRYDEAQRLINQVPVSSPEESLDLIRSLGSIQESLDADRKIEVGKLQLAIADRIWPQRQAFNPDQQLELSRLRAQAFAVSGDLPASRALYEELVAKHPQNGSLHEEFADVLLTGKDQATLQLALEQWRIVASRTKPRTQLWFKAKYSVALAQMRLGDKAGAAKLIRYLQATEDLAASGWEKQFADLLRQCES